MAEADVQAVEGDRPRFDDYMISLLGGLVIGVMVWAIIMGLSAFMQAAAPPGLNVEQVISDLQLTPPPGLDISEIYIVVPQPATEPWLTIVNTAYLAVPVLAGLLAWYIGYKKLIKME